MTTLTLTFLQYSDRSSDRDVYFVIGYDVYINSFKTRKEYSTAGTSNVRKERKETQRNGNKIKEKKRKGKKGKGKGRGKENEKEEKEKEKRLVQTKQEDDVVLLSKALFTMYLNHIANTIIKGSDSGDTVSMEVTGLGVNLKGDVHGSWTGDSFAMSWSRERA